MAELTPVSKIQFNQFKDLYDPNLPYNQQNLMLQSKMDENTFNQYSNIANEEKNLSFIDKFTGGLENLFSAYGAEKSQVPNLDYGYNVPTFDLATGITNTSSASPFLKSMADIAASGTIDTDLVSQLKAEEAAKLSPVTSSVMYDEYPPGFIFRPQVLPLQNLGIDTSYGIANEPDVEQVDYLPGQKKSFRDSKTLKEYSQNRSLSQGLEALLQYLPFGEKSPVTYLLNQILPKESPEIKGMKNFYRNQYGLDPVGRVASGIMAGYNPVSGGFLNMITGGKYGKPTKFGLAAEMQKRIENILGRRAPQTDASRAKVEELRNLQLSEMRDRADRGESLSSIGKSTFSGPGKAFEAKPSGAYSKGFAGGR